jgi:hypothetical protein
MLSNALWALSGRVTTVAKLGFEPSCYGEEIDYLSGIEISVLCHSAVF